MLAVNAADGERVSTGETILTLQPADKLWLKAAYYGADAAAIQTGMTRTIFSRRRRRARSVKVCTVFGALTPDGGESVGLLATTPSPSWLNGESGSVTLNGPVRHWWPFRRARSFSTKGSGGCWCIRRPATTRR